MVTSMALTRNDNPMKLLRANLDVEEPLVLQLGGSCPKEMGEAVKVAVACGYKHFNINVGCPSDKVAGSGCFGAALMRQPSLVGDIAASMADASGAPVSVKCRIGVNDEDSYEALAKFISTVNSVAAVEHFIVHARKAILDKNFTPEQNRNIPPLIYSYVYRLCKDFPRLKFSINGGIRSYEDITEHLSNGVQGVMVGRAAIQNPYYWSEVDARLYNESGMPCFLLLCMEVFVLTLRCDIVDIYYSSRIFSTTDRGGICRLC
jgi:tRNA-dihydrouridine synthase A